MTAERYQISRKKVGSSIPDCKISSMLDINLVSWSTTSRALALTYQPSVSKKKKKKVQPITCCDDDSPFLFYLMYVSYISSVISPSLELQLANSQTQTGSYVTSGQFYPFMHRRSSMSKEHKMHESI